MSSRYASNLLINLVDGSCVLNNGLLNSFERASISGNTSFPPVIIIAGIGY